MGVHHDEVIDLRTTELDLTDRERHLLGEILGREYADVPALGRSMGCSDAAVRETIAQLTAKLGRFAAPQLDRDLDVGTEHPTRW